MITTSTRTLACVIFALLLPAGIAADPLPGEVLYAGSSAGLFKSADGGATWTAANAGINGPGAWVISLAIDPSDPQTLYAGTSGSGVFKSTDAGQTWIPSSYRMTDTAVLALVIDPFVPATLYAATAVPAFFHAGSAVDFFPGSGIFESTDGGLSWTVSNSGLPQAVVETLTIDPANPSVIYAGTSSGLFKTTDGGQDWTAVPGLTTTLVNQVVIDPSNFSTLYAATGAGVFKSVDGGLSWTAANSGLTDLEVLSLAIDPATPEVLYAGTRNGGVFKSGGGGAWFSVYPTQAPTSYGIVPLPLVANPLGGTVYAGGYGVSRSFIGGVNWLGTSGGPAGSGVFALAIAVLPAVLTPTGVFPPSGSGLTQTFTFAFNAPNGVQSLDVVDVLINDSLDGRHACYLAFIPGSTPACTASQCLFLVDDAGDAGGVYAGGALSFITLIGNSQCSVTGGGSASATGNTLTLTLPIQFTPAFAGNKVVYAAARDRSANNSGWQPLGAWNVRGPPPPGPAAVSVSPPRSTGDSQAFTFTFSDTNGFADLSVIDILVNDSLDGRRACYAAFVPSGPASGSVYLVDDAGDPGGPFAGGLVLPGTASVHNQQCAINAAGSSVAAGGNNLTLTLSIAFGGVTFTGNHVIYTAARSSTQTSGWQARGTVSVPPALAYAQ